jgi:hypothetical protein
MLFDRVILGPSYGDRVLTSARPKETVSNQPRGK